MLRAYSISEKKKRMLPLYGSTKMLVIFQGTFDMTMKLHISISFCNIHQGEKISILYFITMLYTKVFDNK
jgi:hypothetical protein